MSQENKTVFEYNGYEYEFDIADADYSEKYEVAIEAMAKEEKEIPKAGKLSEIYRAQCGMIKRFFDNVFVEGAGANVCGARDNVTKCYDAYLAFIEFVKAQRDGVIEAKNSLSKYSNRAQRRAAEHKK